MTVIFSDFDAISPLINCIVAHRKLKSHDQNFLWETMQFINGEIPSKSENITVILIYCPKVSMLFVSPHHLIFFYNIMLAIHFLISLKPLKIYFSH